MTEADTTSGDRPDLVDERVEQEAGGLQGVAGLQHGLRAQPVDLLADQDRHRQREQRGERQRQPDLDEREVRGREEEDHRHRHPHAGTDGVDADRRHEPPVLPHVREAESLQHPAIVQPRPRLRASGFGRATRWLRCEERQRRASNPRVFPSCALSRAHVLDAPNVKQRSLAPSVQAAMAAADQRSDRQLGSITVLICVSASLRRVSAAATTSRLSLLRSVARRIVLACAEREQRSLAPSVQAAMAAADQRSDRQLGSITVLICVSASLRRVSAAATTSRPSVLRSVAPAIDHAWPIASTGTPSLRPCRTRWPRRTCGVMPLRGIGLGSLGSRHDVLDRGPVHRRRVVGRGRGLQVPGRRVGRAGGGGRRRRDRHPGRRQRRLQGPGAGPPRRRGDRVGGAAAAAGGRRGPRRPARSASSTSRAAPPATPGTPASTGPAASPATATRSRATSWPARTSCSRWRRPG